nr:hypothetical protein [Tanacetum cinerariifolium]
MCLEMDMRLRRIFKVYKDSCEKSRIQVFYKEILNQYNPVSSSFIQVAQKKVKKAFENADSSSRVELIPSKIKGASSRKYTTSVTKTKAADYGHIKWIEDLVPRTIWIQEPVCYDKHTLWGISHWGRKRQQFYGFAVNRESARDVYSKRRIIAVTELKIVEWHNYKHLDWIMVRRDDDKLYKFKEGDFKRLHIQDIKDIIVIQRRMEDLKLGVESYQKKLNLTKPDTYRSDLKHKEAYIAYSNLRGFIYQNRDKSILMDLQVTPTKPGRMTKSYSSYRFIANYFNEGNLKMDVKPPTPSPLKNIWRRLRLAATVGLPLQPTHTPPHHRYTSSSLPSPCHRYATNRFTIVTSTSSPSPPSTTMAAVAATTTTIIITISRSHHHPITSPATHHHHPHPTDITTSTISLPPTPPSPPQPPRHHQKGAFDFLNHQEGAFGLLKTQKGCLFWWSTR